MKSKIFISSVQREFAKERKALAEYVRKDAIAVLTETVWTLAHHKKPVVPDEIEK